jgi:phosphatidylglycerol:prolipoprotein diacylglycerol transferase
MFDPIFLEIGPLTIRWYSLAYIVGIIIGFSYVQYLDKRVGAHILTKKLLDKMMLPTILGVIIGGRIGYVTFYNFEYYKAHPLVIFKTWEGGMSFHGGLIGVIIAIFIFCKINKISFLKIMDLISAAAPIGIFLGRIANFINGELYGRYSNMPWAMRFLPYETIKRHPTQLYEAAAEGIITFIIVNIFFIKYQSYKTPAKTSGVFLISYSVFRIIIENFREPDISLGFFWSCITMGQILSMPMLFLGIYCYNRKVREIVV